MLILTVLAGMIGLASEEATADSPIRRSVVTIYNHTPISLHYKLRVKMWGADDWGKWHTKRHVHPNDGHMWHYFKDHVAEMQIRFDCIGGDDDFTEKIIDLSFNVVRKFGSLCKHDGKPHCFKFDAGGKLLHFTKHGW